MGIECGEDLTIWFGFVLESLLGSSFFLILFKGAVFILFFFRAVGQLVTLKFVSVYIHV